MATRVITVLTDDLTGKEGDVQTVTFGLDGVTYEIDLAETNAKSLRSKLDPFIEAARRTSSPKGKRSRSRSRRGDMTAIRQWAAENGHQIADRGRIPQHIIDQYNAR